MLTKTRNMIVKIQTEEEIGRTEKISQIVKWKEIENFEIKEMIEESVC